MRTIKFRGIGLSGKWAYGLLSISQGYEGQPEPGYYISNSAGMPWAYKVLPGSVGQFTGLTDKNGKEIWDGSKVKRRVHLVEGRDYMDYNCTVKWNGWCYGLFVHDKQLWPLDPITARECEVIETTHPELLKEKA